MLTLVQQLAARLVVEGRASEDIARECGKSRRTIETWKKLPEFEDFCAEMCSEAKSRAVEEVGATLGRLQGKAFQRIEQILDEDAIGARTHLQACSLVMKISGLNGDPDEAQRKAERDLGAKLRHDVDAAFSALLEKLLNDLERELDEESFRVVYEILPSAAAFSIARRGHPESGY